MGEPLIIFALLFAFLGLLSFITGIVVLKKMQVFGVAVSFMAALLMLSSAALFATISIATKGIGL